MRIDQYLVINKYFTSRTKAKEEIKNGHVYVNDKQILSPNYDYTNGIIKIINQMPYVSRGGLKLEKAINYFNLDFNDKVILDIGASTGGFTDCALKHGARKVYAVDVGTSQLDEGLKNNPKVVSQENTNILDAKINEKVDILVMDVSFVSIKHLLDALLRFLDDDNYLVCLIKPQFEVGKMINKGIIKDKSIHIKVINNVISYLNEVGLYVNKLTYSPIKGGSGNIEYLALVSKNQKGHIDVNEVVNASHKKEG